MIIARELLRHLKSLAQQFPVVAVMGPRQSGKTTIAKEAFPSYNYVTLEDLDRRAEAKEDPRRFFASHAAAPGLILDEVQQVPELFSYLQGIVDQTQQPGRFILTGSQNFLLHEKISQTLAGRIALLTLLPLTIHELQQAALLPSTLEEVMYKGLYPRLYRQDINPTIWFSNYNATYIEKDVRQLTNLTDVISFQRFLKLCAARTGSLLNYTELARDADINVATTKKWLSILESSYIIKLLYPYYKNYNKRVIKSPKLYFYDTGLVCALLGIRESQDLFIHPMRGALFETLIITELFKSFFNQAQIPNLYFWRDMQGHEIDCVIERSLDNLISIEIKSGMTINSGFFKGLIEWQTIAQQPTTQSYIIYAGSTAHEYSHGHVLPWTQVRTIARTFSNS